MSRILDLTPSSEEAVVSRVLLLVHSAVDEHFPKAEKPNRQFSKTVFSEDGVERTGQIVVPGDRREVSPQSGPDSGASPAAGGPSGRGGDGSTRPDAEGMGDKGARSGGGQSGDLGDMRKSLLDEDHENSSHQGESQSRSANRLVQSSAHPFGPLNDDDADLEVARPRGRAKPLSSHFQDEEVTRLEDTFGLMSQKIETNWVSKVTVAFMIAGVILFVYVLLW